MASCARCDVCKAFVRTISYQRRVLVCEQSIALTNTIGVELSTVRKIHGGEIPRNVSDVHEVAAFELCDDERAVS